VATTLLVAGPTLTFWMPWQTICIHQLIVQSAARLLVWL